MGKTMTVEEFIERARKVHGNKFDYSKVEKIGKAKDKVSLICPLHGIFEQKVHAHLRGQKCRKCSNIINSNKSRKTQEQFIKEAISKHGNKYDYSKVKYERTHGKVIIICPYHGEFLQAASNHIKGKGCAKCKIDKERMKIEDILSKAEEVHKGKYDYSEVVYKNNREKVKIKCKIHGIFLQNIDNHLRLKTGCPICSGRFALGTEEFIRRCMAVHGNRYDYSKVDYKKNDKKVIIVCKEHGDFLQTPNHHMSGSNCPKCCNNQQMTEEEFIVKANKAHNNIYDYSKVNYTHIKKKEIIICPQHGEFLQKLDNHLQGKGCPHCIFKNEGKVKILIDKYFFDWDIIPNKKIWDKYKDYNHRRYCDFWLEKDGIRVIIEYDGEQHFRPMSYISKNKEKAEKCFNEIQQKDKLDKEFCEENGIILHRIRYDEDKELSIINLKNSLLIS